MNFYKRIALKCDKNLQVFPDMQRDNCVTIFKYKYLGLWIAYQFLNSKITGYIVITVGVIAMLASILVKDSTICCVILLLALLIMAPIAIIQGIIMHKRDQKKQSVQEIGDWLIEKVQNIGLINGHVISKLDWWYIRRKNKSFYRKVRSEAYNHKCYPVTHSLSKILAKPDIKILWICIDSFVEKDRCVGHAVLEKKGWIYDTNQRATYKKGKYFEACNVKVFKEYSIDQYLEVNYFTELDWEEFGKWCTKNGATRNT